MTRPLLSRVDVYNSSKSVLIPQNMSNVSPDSSRSELLDAVNHALDQILYSPVPCPQVSPSLLAELVRNVTNLATEGQKNGPFDLGLVSDSNLIEVLETLTQAFHHLPDQIQSKGCGVFPPLPVEIMRTIIDCAIKGDKKIAIKFGLVSHAFYCWCVQYL